MNEGNGCVGLIVAVPLGIALCLIIVAVVGLIGAVLHAIGVQ